MIVSMVDVRIVLMEVCQENMGVDMAVPQINGFCAVVFVNVMPFGRRESLFGSWFTVRLSSGRM